MSEVNERPKDVPKGVESLSRLAKPAAVIALLVVALYAVSVFHGLPFAVIRSNSMEPTLSRGDIAYIRGADTSKLQVGDVVAVEVPESYQDKYAYPPVVIHRIKEIGEYQKGTFIITKGDAAGRDPFRTHVSNVKGVYTGFKVPMLGTILLFLKSTYGLIYIGTLTVAIIGYKTIPAWLKRRRREREFVHRAIATSFETQKSFKQLSRAISNYGEHLESHTSAIKNLEETSEELKELIKEGRKNCRRGQE